MVFSAPIFLFVFLPATVAAAFAVPRRWRNGVLLLASLAFYLWGAGAITLLLVASILGNDLAIRRIAATSGRTRDGWVAGAVVLNLAGLGWFKYAGFTWETGAALMGQSGAPLPAWADVLLPIGISFYTFQAMSAVIDVARGDAPVLPRRRDFGLFVALFPQLIAGPIVRYADMAPQLLERHPTVEGAYRGAARFTLGLAKKVLVADAAARIADAVFAAAGAGAVSTGDAWFGALAYTVQIYFDFSGYSDMAIGLGQVFGFDLPENFARPYGSRTMTEFWRRWHITLSTWFRDYLYIPLGGSRGSSWQTLRNLVIVFLATGLWHGAAWTFVLWGAYHGVILVAERVLGARESASPVRWAVTFLLVVFGWVLFRAETLDVAGRVARAMLQWDGGLSPELATEIAGRPVFALVLGLASVLLPRDLVLGRRLGEGLGLPADGARVATLWVLLPTVLVAAAGADFSPFLYFQF